MSGVESTDPLFGSDDSGPDPFADIARSSSTHANSQQKVDDVFDQPVGSNGSDFFDAVHNGSASQSNTEATQTVPQTSTWPEPAASPDNGRNTHDTTGASNPQSHYTPSVEQSASNGQGAVNGGQSHCTGTSAYSSYTPAQPVHRSQSPYGPYTPPATSYATSAQTYTPAYAPPTQPAYSQSVYAPPIPSSTVNDPYAPPSIPPASTQAANTRYSSPYSTYNPPSAPSQTSSSVVSPYGSTFVPPAQPAAPARIPVERPKISNAYDPPFPTTRPARRAVSRPNLPRSPLEQSATPPPLPPPPRASSASQFTRTFSPSQQTQSTYGSGPSPNGNAYGTIRQTPPPVPTASAPYAPTSYSQPAISSQAAPPHVNGVVYSLPQSTEPAIPSETAVSSYEPPVTSNEHASSPATSGVAPETFSPATTVQPSPAPDIDPEEAMYPSAPLTSFSPRESFQQENPSSYAPVHSTSPAKSVASAHSPQSAQPPFGKDSVFSEAARSSSPSWAKSDSRQTSPAIDPSAPPKNGIADKYAPRTGSPAVSTHSRTGSPLTDPYAPRRAHGVGNEAVGRASSPSSYYAPPPGRKTPAHGSVSPPISSSIPPPPSFGTVLASSTSSYDPYKPQFGNGSAVPDSRPIEGLPQSASYDPPMPSSVPAGQTRNRSTSNGSVLSTSSRQSHDPYAAYAPSLHARGTSIDSNYSSSYSPYAAVSSPPTTESYQIGLAPVQELKAPTYTPYAPSPSLLGTNDPLGRASARVPIVSFGFGGKIVTCFHGAATMNTGFDVALSSKNSTGVDIRVLNKVIPQSALEASSVAFPGPLFSDSGSTITGLVRSGVSSQAKSKKTQLSLYLQARQEELSQGLTYLHSGSLQHRHVMGKLTLVNVLKVMVEHDGHLSGSPEIDTAVRSALVSGSKTNREDTSTVPATLSAGSPINALDSYTSFSGQSNEEPISVSTLRPSALQKIKELLLEGERRQAFHYALDEKLWAHAMVISGGIDKDAWREAVNEFLRSELGQTDSRKDRSLLGDAESLRVAYSYYSGQGPVSVQELVPKKSLAPISQLQPPIPQTTPITPGFAASAQASTIPVQSLSRWNEMVAMMLSSPLTTEGSLTLTSLGDQLLANDWVEAAHVCYLLSPQTSPFGGVAHQSARMTLLGSKGPHVLPNFDKDPDAIIFSELLEFALSLVAPVKGQETFSGIQHLQPYRLVRAIFLAELGDVKSAQSYCEAITTCLARQSPYFNEVFIQQLRTLTDRISGVSHPDKGSWMGGKIGKPSLDSIGGWLESRFNEFLTGGDSPGPQQTELQKSDEKGFFAGYSQISSATTSTTTSPYNGPTGGPPKRSESMVSLLNLPPPSERSASATDYTRRRHSPVGRIASANAATTTFAQSFGQAMTPMTHTAGNEATPRASRDSHDDERGQEVTWWGSSYTNDTSTFQTPTASNFVRVSEDSQPTPSSDGFISLMDSTPFSVTPVSSTSYTPRNSSDDDDDDLGFGNSQSKPKDEPGKGDPYAAKPAPAAKAAAPERPDPKPVQQNSNGSWFSRLWKKEGGPVKASLGEESSFYYDKDLKKWVNKKAGAEEASKPTPPPPPPSRPQTASPAGIPPPSSRSTPPTSGTPPPRASTSVDLNDSPPHNKKLSHVRSNLAPPMPESAPSTPTGTRLAPPAPPPGRPRSQASKRNARSRYVDVFAQEGGGPA